MQSLKDAAARLWSDHVLKAGQPPAKPGDAPPAADPRPVTVSKVGFALGRATRGLIKRP